MIIRRVAAFCRLPMGERLLLVWYLAAVVRLEVVLRCRPPDRVIAGWAATANRRRARGVVVAPSTPAVRRSGLAAQAAAVLRPGRTCLPVALLRWREAIWAGEPAQLVIGVRADPVFAAHAWVRWPDSVGGGHGADGGRDAGLVVLAVWDAEGVLLPRHGGSAVPTLQPAVTRVSAADAPAAG